MSARLPDKPSIDGIEKVDNRIDVDEGTAEGEPPMLVQRLQPARQPEMTANTQMISKVSRLQTQSRLASGLSALCVH